MEFFELLNHRRACHNFLPNVTIPDQDFEKIIKYTSLTPSGYNAQPWEFLIIREPENLAKIKKIAFNQSHLENASAVVFVLADVYFNRHAEKIVKPWVDQGYLKNEKEIQDLLNAVGKERPFGKLRLMALRNTLLAAMTLIYSAENLGYATCPMMGFEQKKMREFLEIPDDRIIALMIAIGKPGEKLPLPRLARKKPEDMIYWEKFTQQKS